MSSRVFKSILAAVLIGVFLNGCGCLSFRKKFGRFNIVHEVEPNEIFETERGIHGDGVLIEKYKLDSNQFNTIKELLEKFDEKKISDSRKEYEQYVTFLLMDDVREISKELISIDEAVYYIIDYSPSSAIHATNYEMIVVDETENVIYYIKFDS